MSNSSFLLSFGNLFLAAGAALLATGYCQQVQGSLGPGGLLGVGAGPRWVTVPHFCAHRMMARAGNAGDGGSERWQLSQVSPLQVHLGVCACIPRARASQTSLAPVRSSPGVPMSLAPHSSGNASLICRW